MIKAKLYDGKNLEGDWNVTFKIDGVRAIFTKEGVFSRAGKPLFNLDHFLDEAPFEAEIFHGDWNNTITLVRTQQGEPVKREHVFRLFPDLDQRLHFCLVSNPTKKEIQELLNLSLAKGYEGLVLRQNDVWLKVKPFETFDVPITGLIRGTGRNRDRLGAFETPMGKVSGMSDQEREEYYNTDLIGKIIEVECMELTKNGKFRHPRFKRIRWDKSA